MPVMAAPTSTCTVKFLPAASTQSSNPVAPPCNLKSFTKFEHRYLCQKSHAAREYHQVSTRSVSHCKHWLHQTDSDSQGQAFLQPCVTWNNATTDRLSVPHLRPVHERHEQPQICAAWPGPARLGNYDLTQQSSTYLRLPSLKALPLLSATSGATQQTCCDCCISETIQLRLPH
jgi:hypothetical protein